MSRDAVLFVDDEVEVLSSLRRELMGSEYRCIFANSATEALDILNQKDIDVIVTDMKMPKMNGLELLKIIQEKFPTVVRVILSGYTHLPQVIAAINNGHIYKFIPKPWDFDKELKPFIDEALNYRKYLAKLYSINTHNTPDTELQEDVEKFREIVENMNCIFKEVLNSNLNDDSKNKIINMFKIYESIYFEYINTISTNTTTYSLNALNEQINNRLKKINKDNIYLKLESSSTEEIYKGNISLISFVIALFLENLAEYSINNIITPKVSIENGQIIDSMNTIIAFTLKRGNVYDIGNKTIKNELSTLSSILEQICKLIDSSLVISVIHDKVFAKLDIPLIKNTVQEES